MFLKNETKNCRERYQRLLLNQRLLSLYIQQQLSLVFNSTQSFAWYILFSFVYIVNVNNQIQAYSLNPAEYDEENWDESDWDEDDDWEDDEDWDDEDLEWDPDNVESDDEDEWDEDNGIDMEDEEEWN